MNIGDRVTIVRGQWSNVLGTVKNVTTGEKVVHAYVEWKALSSAHLGWYPVTALTVWRSESD